MVWCTWGLPCMRDISARTGPRRSHRHSGSYRRSRCRGWSTLFHSWAHLDSWCIGCTGHPSSWRCSHTLDHPSGGHTRHGHRSAERRRRDPSCSHSRCRCRPSGRTCHGCCTFEACYTRGQFGSCCIGKSQWSCRWRFLHNPGGCHSWRQSSKACSDTSHWSSRRSWGHSSLGWSTWGP